MKNNNLIITGPSRSGTTLTCYLLNKLPNTVALHEPLKMGKLAQNPQTINEEIDRFFEQTRQSLSETGTAISKTVNGGAVPDNPIGGYSRLFRWLPNRFLGQSIFGKAVLRKIQHSSGHITVNKNLSSNFLLCIKHNGPFTVLLENLLCHYPCYAVVRNPLAILSSWNSVHFKLQQGHFPNVERLDHALFQNLAKITDRFERQLYILSWFFEIYNTLLPQKNVIYYEDIVASKGTALKVITPDALELNEPLENKNNNKLYNRQMMRKLGEKLLKTDGAYWEFYTKESVEQLLSNL